MIRQQNNTKMAKPPPPVPPRPSKTIVAEALAKTRKQTKPTVPVRTAPPPPHQQQESNCIEHLSNIAKSKSTTSMVNTTSTKPTVERSISVNEEDTKKNTRTVIFQSSQMKTSKIEVNLQRKESDRLPIKRVNSFNKSSTNDQKESKAEVTLKRRESDRKVEEKTTTTTKSTNWNEVLINDRNHVNTLIDEMFAKVLGTSSDTEPTDNIDNNESNSKTKITIKNDNETKPTVLVIDNTCDESNCDLLNGMEKNKSGSSTGERKEKRVKFDDKLNHELLVAELQNMHKNDSSEESSKISRSDWIEVNDGKEVRLSSCQITIEEKNNNSNVCNDDELVCRLSAMSNLQGLPPLPKSLSGFSLMEVPQTPSRPSSSRTSTPASGHMVYPPHPRSVNNVNGTDVVKKNTNLDAQLAILRREMVSHFLFYYLFLTLLMFVYK